MAEIVGILVVTALNLGPVIVFITKALAGSF